MKGKAIPMVLALLMTMTSFVFPRSHKYCKLESCPNSTHTLCRYTKLRPVKTCGDAYISGLGTEDIRRMIILYNNERPTIKLSENKSNSDVAQNTNNSATVEYAMEWDDELAEIAQRWANQCKNETDTCRNVDRFNVRQRVGLLTTSIYDSMPSVHSLITRWYKEDRSIGMNELDFENLSFLNLKDSVSRLYTLLMGQTADKFGCGAVRAYDERHQFLYLVCNYGPA